MGCQNQRDDETLFSRRLFDLPEYDGAFTVFVYRAVNELMKEKDPFLGALKTVQMPQVPTIRNTLASGEVVENKPIMSASPFEVDLREAVEGHFDGLLSSIDEVAEETLKQIMPVIFEYIGRLTQAAGTSYDAKGQPLSHDIMLDAFETMEIEFDREGKPEMPTWVVNPEMAKAIRALPPATRAQEQRFKDIVSKKRQEYDARQRHRKLS